MGARGRAWLAAHQHVVAAALLGLVVLAYLWPVLIGGRILSPAYVLFGFPPWQGYQVDGLPSYLNRVLVDPPLTDYPWRAMVRELLHAGTFPAWNQHVFAGIPLFSNPQTGLFSIFSLPLWLLPLDYGVGLGAALKLWAAGFGTWLLARELRLGFLPGLLGGVAFAFCALNIVWLTHETLPAVAALLPWMVWLVERIARRARPVDALWLALATALGLGGGHPGMQLHLLLAVALYAAMRLALAQEGERRLRAAGLAAGGLALGTLLMAVMLVPEALSSRGTLGTVARHGGEGDLPGSQMAFESIKTVVFPDWWGRPSAFEVEAGALPATLANYNERTLYGGAVALLLALVGFLAPGRRRAAAPFAVLAVVGIAIPLHAPVLYWLMTHLPLLEEVQSQRMHFIYAFAAAVGAAFGLQALLDRPQGQRWRLAVPGGALALAAIAWAGAGAQPGDVGRVLRHFATGVDFPSASVVALTSVAWFLLFALGVGAALLAAARWPSRRVPIAACVVLLAVVDAFHFAHGYQPMARVEQVMPPVTPALAYLQRHRDEGRFVGLGPMLPSDSSLLFGLDDVRGYDPPQPTLRFYRLWQLANPQQADWRPFQVDALGPEALKVVSLLGARWVIADPGIGALPTGDGALDPLRRVHRSADASVWLNPNAVERVQVPSRVVRTAEEAETRSALVAPGFDPRTTAVVEGAPGVEAGAGRAAIADEGNARVTLRATLQRRGLVVLNDALADGWRVEVDGREADVVRVNDVMRGVVVDPGSHEIVWSYRVPGLRLGLALSLLALAALLGCAAALVMRARRVRP